MERRILVLTSWAHFLTHLTILVYPTIAVVQARQWGVDVTDLLVLTLPGFIAYGVCAVPFGMWADRRPGSLPVVTGLLGMGVGALLCAAADGRWQIAAGLSVIGVFAAAYHPSGLGLITHGVKRASWALGLNGSFGSAGVAFAPGVAELLTNALGWRGAFVVLAIPALAGGLLFLMLPVSLPRVTVDPTVAGEPGSARLFTPGFVVLCVAMTLNGLAYRGTTVVLPTLFAERVSFVGHGVATSMTYLLAIVMNYVGGSLAERYKARWVYAAFHLVSLPGILATAWLGGLPLMVAGALYTGCALGTQAAENTLVAQLTPRERRGVAFGMKFTLAFGVGALAVPLSTMLLRAGGTSAVQLGLSVFVVALVALLLTQNRRLAPVAEDVKTR